MGAQNNRLIETVLLSTHNICFGWEINKNGFPIRTLIWRPGVSPYHAGYTTNFDIECPNPWCFSPINLQVFSMFYRYVLKLCESWSAGFASQLITIHTVFKHYIRVRLGVDSNITWKVSKLNRQFYPWLEYYTTLKTDTMHTYKNYKLQEGSNLIIYLYTKPYWFWSVVLRGTSTCHKHAEDI